ncbi:MAG TPA: NAD(P)-dependent oxidoreductase [Polyangiaceae bacterium]|nr:NAD(P)-dependent oxidoreductase [Polyangiaceae bacterium]
MARALLITGAAGFVGQRLAHAAADHGWQVIGLDRSTGEQAGTVGSAFADFWQCDLLDEPALSGLSKRCAFDAIVHLAGVLPGRATRGEMFAVNTGGTSAVLEHFGRPGCHVVFFSTGLVYGEHPAPFHEGLECFPAEPYAQSKRAAELLVSDWARRTGSPAAIMRPSVLYGVGAPAGMLLISLLSTLRKKQPFEMTAGEQLRDFLHVDDAVRAVVCTLDQRASGTWNLAHGTSHSVKEAAELGAAIAHGGNLLRVGALPYREQELFDYRLDSHALQQAINWKPQISLAAGLESLWKEIQ